MSKYFREFFVYSALLFFIFMASFTKADAQEQDVYFGLSGGQTRVKNTATQEYQDATSLGVKIGMRIYSSEAFWSGAEINYGQTTAKQEVTVSGSSSVSSYELTTTGLYLTGRTRGKVYIKGKIGAANRVIQVNNVTIQDTTEPSVGIGAGLRQGRTVLEIEYTQYGDDVTTLSVGYVF